MISDELKAQIKRLKMVEGFRPATIARHLGIHRATVRKVLRGGNENSPERKKRPKLIDNYLASVKECLDKYPDVSSSLLFRLAKKRGYKGVSAGHFRRMIAAFRKPQPHTAYLTIETLAGEEAQVDWAHFGSVEIGKSKRNLVAFVMTLSHSRKIFLRFFHSMSSAFFCQGFVEAFRAFNGVSKRILVDNCKTAVVENHHGIIRFNKDFLSLAAHYNFEPIAARVKSPTDKGKIERVVRYIRTNFGIEFQKKVIVDLNIAAKEWCETEAQERRCPGNKQFTVAEIFKQEQRVLISLPAEEYICLERHEYVVPKNLFLRFDRNSYSVPRELVGQAVTLFASETRIGIQHQGKEICEHVRSWDSQVRIENTEHFQKLREERRQAKTGSQLGILTTLFPSLKNVLEKAALAGANIGSMVIRLLKLRATVGEEILGQAIHQVAKSERCFIADIQREIDVIQLKSVKPPPTPETIELPLQAIIAPLKPIDWNKYEF